MSATDILTLFTLAVFFVIVVCLCFGVANIANNFTHRRDKRAIELNWMSQSRTHKPDELGNYPMLETSDGTIFVPKPGNTPYSPHFLTLTGKPEKFNPRADQDVTIIDVFNQPEKRMIDNRTGEVYTAQKVSQASKQPIAKRLESSSQESLKALASEAETLALSEPATAKYEQMPFIRTAMPARIVQTDSNFEEQETDFEPSKQASKQETDLQASIPGFLAVDILESLRQYHYENGGKGLTKICKEITGIAPSGSNLKYATIKLWWDSGCWLPEVD